MSDLVPIERLQPCLLDRLTDDEPHKKEESRTARVISHQKYRRGVLRDLEWLFNTNAYLSIPGTEEFDLRDYPEAWRSVLNFGTRQLCGMTSPNIKKIAGELADAIKFFEPRISAQGLVIQADIERNSLTFQVQGQLWSNPIPEHLHVRTTVDLETGRSILGDSTNG
jgi:type VI secretion system protein ImpF